MIYLDSASTTLKKPISVYYAVIKAMLRYNANAGRSGHDMSIRAGYEVYKARQAVADFFNYSAERVIFTSGCTEALNLAIMGSVKDGGHIITSAYEHNSTLRVLKHLEKLGKITYTIIQPKGDGRFDVTDFEKAITPKTYMIAVNHISNVLGVKMDIAKLGAIAKRHNLLFLVDTAQSAGHEHIDMEMCGISMLAFAGHKGLLGLQGVGGLIVREGVTLHPIKFGGTGMNSDEIDPPVVVPESFECGTLPLVGIVSLRAGIEYVQKHFERMQDRIETLTEHLLDSLGEIENIKIYTPLDCFNGVVAFNIKGYSSMEICDYLNEKHKICVRSGLTCAPLVHKHLGTTSGGVVRVSIAYYNKKSHIDKLVNALKALEVR